MTGVRMYMISCNENRCFYVEYSSDSYFIYFYDVYNILRSSKLSFLILRIQLFDSIKLNSE